MDLLLNKKIIILFAFLSLAFIGLAQDEERINERDYKDPKQHKKFYRRSRIVGAWQINQLKTGALVVKLKTNKILIDALLKKGDTRMAEKKRLETLARNINISNAYRRNYTFSKLYFIYSSSGDSLLNGARSNIFLDSNLVVDSSIKMNESFYLIAETDNIYNSSIGFVDVDSARFVSEKGSKTTTEAAIILKNKFGHQLKKPFPYLSYEFPLRKSIYNQVVSINAVPILFNIDNVKFHKGAVYMYEGKPLDLTIPADFTYAIFSYYVDALNQNLLEYFQGNPSPMSEKMTPEIKKFLY